MVVFFGIVGFVAPMLYGYANDFAVPHVHDELVYIFAGETYSEGRLTNPTPPFYEHFEAPHILVKPSYTSKYPPMQGLFIAAGLLIFGHPIFGIWLSCGFFAAALFWMLSAWSKPTWAIIGTVFMIAFIGISSYWAQSYWGGMAAAGGGALFLGGFRHLINKISLISTLLMTSGAFMLLNSRPYEGTAMMLPALLYLLIWILRNKKNSLHTKLTKVVFPGIVLSVVSLSAMAYYNYRVTGEALTFPYSIHQKQYFSTPIFIFQSTGDSTLEGHQRVRKLYDFLNGSQPVKNLDFYGVPDYPVLYPLYAVIYLSIVIPYFLFSLPFLLFFYAGVIFIVIRDKWMRLIAGTIFFTFLCMSLVAYWDNVHYAAPLACCFYLLLIESFRYFILSGKKGFQRKLVTVILILLTVFSFCYQMVSVSANSSVQSSSKYKEISNLKYDFEKPVTLDIPERTTYLKPVIEKLAEKQNGKYLAIISYDKEFTIHDDIVYNNSNLEESKIIWAYSLDVEKNRNLINFYKDRKLLLINISRGKVNIKPVN